MGDQLIPTFNLGDEKWLPVRYLAGQRKVVGFTEVFTDAHLIADLDVGEPAAWYATYRYLVSLLYTLRVRTRAEPAGEGYAPGDVNRLVARFYDTWWLHHPQSPFLQTAGLAENAADCKGDAEGIYKPWMQAGSFWASAGWWHIYPETDLPLAAAAMLPLLRHYLAMPNNASWVSDQNGVIVKRTPGGLAVNGPRSLTHFVPAPTSPTASLKDRLDAGIHRDLLNRMGEQSVTFFEVGYEGLAEQATRDDALFAHTFTGAATWLRPTDNGTVSQVLLTGLPWDKQDAEVYLDACRRADPYTIKAYKKPDGASNTELSSSDLTNLNLPLAVTGLRNIAYIMDRAVSVTKTAVTNCVVDGSFLTNRQRTFSTIHITTNGNAQSGVLEDVGWGTFEWDLRILDPTDFKAPLARNVRRLLDWAASQNGFRGRLRNAVAGALTPAGGKVSPAAAAVARSAEMAWWSAVDDLVDTALDRLAQGEELTPTQLIGLSRELFTVTVDVYTEYALPFAVTAKDTERYFTWMRTLKGQLWRLNKNLP